MNKEVKQEILDEIKKYKRIIISRHFRPDGDAVGSSLGLAKIIRNTYPDKEVFVVNEDYCEYVSFLNDEKEPVADDLFKGALQIIVDTATIDRISNKRYGLAEKIIKIDHHIVDEKSIFGDIAWVEDTRSSASEMIVDFYDTFKDELKLDKDAALCLYTGLVTDSGRFKYEMNGETFRMAGILMDQGIDTATLYARLYLNDFDYLKYLSYVYKKMQITENGVAYIYIDKKMQKKFNLTYEEASNTVSALGEIKGCIVWLAFIDNPDKDIRVRLRSRFVTVNELAGKYEGGGHACASGATVHNKKQIKMLVEDADKLVKEYKANNFYL